MSLRLRRPVRRSLLLVAAAAVAFFGGAWLTSAIVTDLTLVDVHHDPAAEHTDQAELYSLVSTGQGALAFEAAFERGDELFETDFNALDGVGANVGQGQRFTRVPRADLAGPGQWAQHTPARATGPNAVSCTSCHLQAFQDGSGSSAADAVRDPRHTGDVSKFIERNTPHLFAPGAVQRLAEEMTARLQRIRDNAQVAACLFGSSTRSLTAKGVNFGTITAQRLTFFPCTARFDTSGVKGVDADLVVRPFQWKGNFAFLRAFNRDAAHNELGMQAVELVGDGVDGDFDGVADELTIGDMTALAVYAAAQPRPTTRVELASLGLLPPLTPEETADIAQGEQVFTSIGCASCHRPSLVLNDAIFSEPSQNPQYRDAVFPAGQDPVGRGVEPALAIRFDLTWDQPDNQVKDGDGNVTYRLGVLRRDIFGRAVVELFGDLKRHDMGVGLAESIDETGTGASVFLTENLWGVASTAPYLHDGRATTLTEAILEHGGEAAPTRRAFRRLPTADQKALLAYLNNLVLFKMEEGEVTLRAPGMAAAARERRHRRP